MSTDIGLDFDMNMAQRWPGRVRVHIQVEHLQGPVEDWWVTLDPGSTHHAVRVMPGPGFAASEEARQLPWQELPGRTLRLRSLAAVAAALFGSVKMAPRICGLPMYRGVSLAVAADGHERHATHVQLRLPLQGGDALHATLRRRDAADQPWYEHAVVLQRWDADPLRAVLRLAMSPPQTETELPWAPATRASKALEATAAAG